MSPWEILAWAVAVAVSLIVLAIATAVVIAVVKASRAGVSVRRRVSKGVR